MKLRYRTLIVAALIALVYVVSFAQSGRVKTPHPNVNQNRQTQEQPTATPPAAQTPTTQPDQTVAGSTSQVPKTTVTLNRKRNVKKGVSNEQLLREVRQARNDLADAKKEILLGQQQTDGKINAGFAGVTKAVVDWGNATLAIVPAINASFVALAGQGAYTQWMVAWIFWPLAIITLIGLAVLGIVIFVWLFNKAQRRWRAWRISRQEDRAWGTRRLAS